MSYEPAPHAHLRIDQLLPAEEYRTLSFPDHLILPEKWGLTASDAEYQSLLHDPKWAALHRGLTGPAFVQSVLAAFAPAMSEFACLVDPERARLVPFVESREEKEQSSLSDTADANEIFVRLDFQSKPAGGYRDFVHLDWPRRIVGGILFFSDADEEGLDGGELAFYRDRGFRNDRWCHDPELVATFPPRANSGIIFLNSNGAFHGPRPIRALRGRRRWLYYTISSRRDVWPCAERLAEAAAARRTASTTSR